jgi:hypothetical protein
MKQIYTLFFILFFGYSTCAQEFSYGITAGGVAYNALNNRNHHRDHGDQIFDSGNIDFFTLNAGVYGEYNFTNKMGIKLELTTNKKAFEKTVLGYYEMGIPQVETKVELSYIDINPNFKYDFGKTYRKGFYMMIGPRFTLLTKAKDDRFGNVKGNFESMHIGAQLGLGQRILKIIEIEGKFDYGLTPFFKSGGSEARSTGFYLSLNVDVARIITKK